MRRGYRSPEHASLGNSAGPRYSQNCDDDGGVAHCHFCNHVLYPEHEAAYDDWFPCEGGWVGKKLAEVICGHCAKERMASHPDEWCDGHIWHCPNHPYVEEVSSVDG